MSHLRKRKKKKTMSRQKVDFARVSLLFFSIRRRSEKTVSFCLLCLSVPSSLTLSSLSCFLRLSVGLPVFLSFVSVCTVIYHSVYFLLFSLFIRRFPSFFLLCLSVSSSLILSSSFSVSLSVCLSLYISVVLFICIP